MYYKPTDHQIEVLRQAVTEFYQQEDPTKPLPTYEDGTLRFMEAPQGIAGDDYHLLTVDIPEDGLEVEIIFKEHKEWLSWERRNAGHVAGILSINYQATRARKLITK